MHASLALFRQHLREQRLTTWIWTGVLVLLSYAMVSVAPTVVADNLLFGLLKDAPPAMARLYGNLFAYPHPVDAYLQFKWMLFFPLLTTIFGVLAAMSVMSRDIDRHAADFVLTMPITRSRVLLARYLTVAVDVALLHIASYVVLWVGLTLLDIPAAFAEYAYFYTGAYCLVLALAAFTLWLSVLVEEYTTAVRTGLIVGVTLWTLSLVSRMLGGPVWFSRLLVFGWLDTESIIARSEFPWGAVFTGLALTGLFLYGGVVAFSRKQIVA